MEFRPILKRGSGGPKSLNRIELNNLKGKQVLNGIGPYSANLILKVQCTHRVCIFGLYYSRIAFSDLETYFVSSLDLETSGIFD